MYLFAIATLMPVTLFAVGAALGGLWALAALAYMTVFVFVMDERVAYAGGAAQEGAEFPAADRLSILLGGMHFALLLLAIAAVGGATGLGWGARIALFMAFGLYFGQVSNSNAHELIHRSRRGLFRLGMWIYISLLFGHHTSAHRHIHHRFVGTVDDPNTAVLGQGFYAFAPQAWWGSFRAGAEIETALRKSRRADVGPHPYAIYLGGALACLLLVAALFGLGGVVSYLLLAAYAQMQLLVSDYVQHYGLERRRERHGRTQAVGPGHSWNAPHWYSGAMMLNAPRHSAHHQHPGTPFPGLALPARGAAPMLPFSLPVMGAIALFPPLWRRMMDKRVERWRAKAPPPPPAVPEPVVSGRASGRPRPVAVPTAPAIAKRKPRSVAANAPQTGDRGTDAPAPEARAKTTAPAAEGMVIAEAVARTMRSETETG
ncbi:hypothetical protein U879_08685 [Defluviimonas sp. 20V17]|uniref:Alkane 1-monooxygenase n=1 Tax=Allgaiera indica TaxID=765699 RepID=A0AAN4ZYL1_9RHOB|nr:alkane 1-monooxygenase [Allgaiera indica]KDB04086.1 hypothetical protein U879_08685 [Defluviimonas sp. 20V17]GHD99423.1 alkane 1-monooxygenase [Allgaiera indica]SDW26223.1 alkane 1-monooxygenase [Allgaiera indica]